MPKKRAIKPLEAKKKDTNFAIKKAETEKIFDYIGCGKPSKDIAKEMGLTEGYVLFIVGIGKEQAFKLLEEMYKKWKPEYYEVIKGKI